jgi:hypothetical protein
MAQNKTQPTGASVEDFIAAVPDEQRRADARTLLAMMERLTGEAPYMWGPTIIGFGSYAYKCGKRDETAPRSGFSPRGKETVVYLDPEYPGKQDQLARLGKHRTGKSCLYIKKLADVDEGVLGELITTSLASMDEKYPRGG